LQPDLYVAFLQQPPKILFYQYKMANDAFFDAFLQQHFLHSDISQLI